jgi:hypothetical protein
MTAKPSPIEAARAVRDLATRGHATLSELALAVGRLVVALGFSSDPPPWHRHLVDELRALAGQIARADVQTAPGGPIAYLRSVSLLITGHARLVGYVLDRAENRPSGETIAPLEVPELARVDALASAYGITRDAMIQRIVASGVPVEERRLEAAQGGRVPAALSMWQLAAADGSALWALLATGDVLVPRDVVAALLDLGIATYPSVAPGTTQRPPGGLKFVLEIPRGDALAYLERRLAAPTGGEEQLLARLREQETRRG